MWLSWKLAYYDSQCGWKYETVFKLYFKCMCCFTCVHVWAPHACSVLRLEEDLRFPGTGVTVIYEQPCKCYELNFSPLQEQTALNYWVISPDPGIKCYVWFGMYNCFLYIWNTHPVTNNRNLQTPAIFHLILAFCLFCETNSHVSQAVLKLTASPMLALNAWSSWFNWTLFIFYFLLGIHKFMCIYNWHFSFAWYN